MLLRSSKRSSPRPETGLQVTIWPPNFFADSEASLDKKSKCEVLDEGHGFVRVRWLDDVDYSTDIPLEWWESAAFACRSSPQLEPSCELCGSRFTKSTCQDFFSESFASACHSCRALFLLYRGLPKEAEDEMSVALRSMAPRANDLEHIDVLHRHWSSVRTALGLLDSIELPTPLNLADVDEMQGVDVSSLEAFKETWQRWLEHYLARQDIRSVCQIRLTKEISKAKRIYGDGVHLDAARRRAEGSLAWRRRFDLEEFKGKCKRGMQQVRYNAETGNMALERMMAILRDKEIQLQQFDEEITAHEQSAEFAKVRMAFEDYARWLHGSGIAAFMEERQNLGCSTPSVHGQFLEDVAARWLESETRPPLTPGLHYKILRNVCFRGVTLPDEVSSEFDAMVVVCRLCDELSSPPKQAGPREGLWQVTSLYRWVEVKSSPDEVLEAWCRHRDARCALASWSGFIGFDHGSDGRFWFPQSVFAEFNDGVTFITMPGFRAVCQGSQVPYSLLTPGSLLMRLFQFALDSISPDLAMDVDDPMSHWDYVEELYFRSGELFMREGRNAEDYRGYLQTAVSQLRELIDKGQVLVSRDPFCSCYQRAVRLARTEKKLIHDELCQAISYFLY